MIIVNNMNPNKLHDELINAGINPVTVKYVSGDGGELVTNTIWITFEDNTDMELVQQIIDAHDPTPPPVPKTELEILRETVDMLVVESLEGMYNV